MAQMKLKQVYIQRSDAAGVLDTPAWPHRIANTVRKSFGNFMGVLALVAVLRVRFTARAKAQLKSAYRARHLYAIDLALSAVALFSASYLRYGPDLLSEKTDQLSALGLALLVFVGICAFVFPASGLYRRNWNFASIAELFDVLKAVVVSSLIFVFVMFLFTRLQWMPRSVVAMEVLILAPLLLSLRIRSRIGELPILRTGFIKLVGSKYSETIPILLAGVCPSTDLYLRALQRDPASSYEPVGILDDGTEQQGLVLRGVPVLGFLADFESVFANLELQGKRPRHLIFSESVAQYGEHLVQHLIQQAEQRGIAVSRLSPATELRNARTENRFELKTIELTDLLERPQTALDQAALRRLIFGRRVLVTGAGGSIGSELTQQIAALLPSELILIENSEYNLYVIDVELREKFGDIPRQAYLCDVRDTLRVNEIFDHHRPELVFHAAALKHVPMVEFNPCEGVMTNTIGTMNIAAATQRINARAMVQISTDKAVNTTNVMGASKRLAELYCQALDIDDKAKPNTPRFMTVRFGNVLGSSGSLIPLFKRQISRGGPLTVTDPGMTRFFMTIREAVELTMQASACGLEKGVKRGEIFVLDMGEPVKIIDIARRMIRLAGYTPDKDIKIEIIGCRPGEKLFEELFDDAEERVASPVAGVLVATSKSLELLVLREVLARIGASAAAGDEHTMFLVIKELLPHYQREQRKRSSVPHAVTDAAAVYDNGALRVSA